MPGEDASRGMAMERKRAAERIGKLRAAIRHHDYLYYVKDAPAVADEEYDRLYRELVALEAEHPDLLAPDSPTQRVAGQPLTSFPTVPHLAPLLSLDSDREESALVRFDERVRKGLGAEVEVSYVLEPKLDGASVELVYEDGVLLRASTRGDGTKGEGITENIRTIPTVPLRLRDDAPHPRLLAVRGEVIMHSGPFDKLNERLLAEGREPFSNPRNAASGALRQLDPQLTASRPLDLYAYDLIYADGAHAADIVAGAQVTTQWEVLQTLAAWGLRVNPLVRRGTTVAEILAYHQDLEEKRDDLGFEIDGIVIKLDDLAARDQLGWTSRHPRWAFAFKFPPRKEVTRILSIVPSVGRTGVVTPVAHMLPVEIGGVTVARATLHNREEVVRKDVREGDRVRVQRAGDVIPQVIERIDEPDRERGPVWQMPPVCPSCGTPLVERGPFTVCPNGFNCPAQLAGRIVHLASRDALDIEGLGEESAKLFVAQGLVRRLPDLFDLLPEQLVELEGFALKSATKLVENLAKASKTGLPRFLYGLGIPEVGVAVARDLARHFGSLGRLRAADEDTLEEVSGVGPRMAEQITTFFRDPGNSEVLDDLLQRVEVAETAPAAPAATAPAGPFAGKKFVFTGGLSRIPRRQAQELVVSLGARATSSVSKGTDYVVVGEDAGSKAEDARKLGVQTLDEEAFLALLKEVGVEV
ncbi:MAG TPA: NAD-dependent DNA ligase LigA [Thermoanaerobaculia bacterium]|nr:NAD-dependent DNA ligase LigA [Thermoanaerobaculia bacterium]